MGWTENERIRSGIWLAVIVLVLAGAAITVWSLFGGEEEPVDQDVPAVVEDEGGEE